MLVSWFPEWVRQFPRYLQRELYVNINHQQTQRHKSKTKPIKPVQKDFQKSGWLDTAQQDWGAHWHGHLCTRLQSLILWGQSCIGIWTGSSVKQAETVKFLKSHWTKFVGTEAFSELPASRTRQAPCFSLPFRLLTWRSLQDSLATPEPMQEGLNFFLWEKVTWH